MMFKERMQHIFMNDWIILNYFEIERNWKSNVLTNNIIIFSWTIFFFFFFFFKRNKNFKIIRISLLCDNNSHFPMNHIISYLLQT